jgi:hypothetical protein
MHSSGERFQSFEGDDVNNINVGRKVNYGHDKTRMRIPEHENIPHYGNWRSTVEQGCLLPLLETTPKLVPPS